jgi:hypothetical protein
MSVSTLVRSLLLVEPSFRWLAWKSASLLDATWVLFRSTTSPTSRRPAVSGPTTEPGYALGTPSTEKAARLCDRRVTLLRNSPPFREARHTESGRRRMACI